jgi:acetyl-CoA carboxylase carboxyltransferase component
MEAINDAAARQTWFEAKLAELVEHGKALSIASVLEIDAVIDPQDTRRWLLAGLAGASQSGGLWAARAAAAPNIDAW